MEKPKRITLLTLGTQGDVQPFVALAIGLRAAGHDVSLATGTNFQKFVEGRGIDFAPLRADFLELIQSEEGKASVSGKGLGAWKSFRTTILPMFRRVLDDSWDAARGSDAIIYHPKVIGAYDIAESLGVPAFVAAFLPILVPTEAFPHPLNPVGGLGGRANRLTYSLNRLATLPFFGMLNEWRRVTLGLPPRRRWSDDLKRDGRPIPVLHAFSPNVIPRPDDWGPSAVATGYWFLDRPADWQPSEDLLRFLDAGPPPVYVGFGSMAGQEPEAMTRLVVDALASVGRRGILAKGWGGLAGVDLPDSVLAIDSAPHDWLFPRTAAVVHHGGAGTTAEGLRAGRPTVVCPHFADQPFWGRVVSDLGVGPAPIPHKRLSAGRLAGAIEIATTDDGLRQRAEALGRAIREEDGVGRAVRFIESTLAEARKS